MSKIMELADDYAKLSVDAERENDEHGTVGAEAITWVDEARAALVSEVERMEAESEAVGRSNKYLAAQLEAACAEIEDLRNLLYLAFIAHPDLDLGLDPERIKQ